jgi:non-ribosomal peptide synthetase-like protein
MPRDAGPYPLFKILRAMTKSISAELPQGLVHSTLGEGRGFNILRGPVSPDLLRDEVLADLLEASAASTPDQIALIFGDRQLSYFELNSQADVVASNLIAAGVVVGDIVGLWLPRGIELLVMQAGIAKSGAAWLPFDADTPADRVAVCLVDASARGLVSCSQLIQETAVAGAPVWTVEVLSSIPNVLRRRSGVGRNEPAYVIYTSGSTGKPKGIVVNQGSICHFLRSENAVLGIRHEDRVYQGFSVAFDMSFEEIWISYLVGATLWIAPKSLASDPEELPRALQAQNITVIHAVPTLLALFAQDVPSLRLINLGGEMCPAGLVDRWATLERQVFNTYGPTEATVSASLARLVPNETVTIGTPLPNYGLLVIDPSTDVGLTLLDRGITGELCIIGPGVAAGYLGRPDLTDEKFLVNPWSTGEHDTRLYRTGDLARIEANGQVMCLGRTDDQVKIRGFRVELGEIEGALAAQPGVGTVAVILRQEDGLDQLIAFIVPEGVAGISAATLRTALASTLPAYMIPGFFEELAKMPRLASGKIDRKTLKSQVLAVSASDSAASDTPSNPAEDVLFAALRKLFPGQALYRSSDFFADLGGHSLFAARLASALRSDSRFTHVTVRDIYQNRTIGRIADAIGALHAVPERVSMEWPLPPAWKRWVCGAGQAIAVPVLVAMRMGQWMAPFFAFHFYTGDPGDSIGRAIGISVAVFLLATILEFGVALLGKRLIAGRLEPGSYPLWGLTYYRWWLSDRLVESAPTYMLSGSPLYVWWLRALGANIGDHVQVGSMTLRCPELLTIEDGVSIGNAVCLENVRVEQGRLHIGTIHLERDSCVGSYAVVEGNTRIGKFGHLEGQSSLSSGQHLPAYRVWTGSPAVDIGSFSPIDNPLRPTSTRVRRVSESIFFVVALLVISALFFMPAFPSFVLIDWLDDADRFPWLKGTATYVQLMKYFLLAFPASAVLIVCTALVSSGIRLCLPRMRPGTWPVHSNVYCAKWLIGQIQESSLNVLHGIFATMYASTWFRLLGAKVGRSAEISSAIGVVPDLLTLGDDTFIADAVMLGDDKIDGGWMTLRNTVISKRSFVGNGAFVPDGTTLPENVLIGVHSKAPDSAQIRPGDTWLGSPAINLPAREQTSGFPESLTFRPSNLRRLGRALVEAFRIIAPHAIMTSVGYTIVLDLMPAAGAGRWGAVLWDLTVIGMLYGLGSFVFVAALKWVFVFRYKTRTIPMWTPFVWVSEAVTNLYEGIAVPNFLRYLRGTPWLPLAMNLLGCHIGRGVYLDTTDITEFDCVYIGDHSELNAMVCPQTHLFEDRVMKIDAVHIGSRVYVGPRTTVLYSAVVGDGARLGPLTLVMKGENIPGATRWSGCPAAPG